jgi:WD40 repeat protein
MRTRLGRFVVLALTVTFVGLVGCGKKTTTEQAESDKRAPKNGDAGPGNQTSGNARVGSGESKQKGFSPKRLTLNQMKEILSVSFSPSGNLLAVAHSPAGADYYGEWSTHQLAVLDATTVKETYAIPRCQRHVFSPDGTRLAVLQADPVKQVRSVAVFDAATGKELTSIPDATLMTPAFSADGNSVVAGGKGGINIYDTRTGSPKVTLQVDEGLAGDACFSPDGKYVACANVGTASISLWDTTSGGRAQLPGNERLRYLWIRFSPDGKQIAGVTEDYVRVYDIGSRSVAQRLETYTDRTSAGAFSPDWRTLVMCVPEVKIVQKPGFPPTKSFGDFHVKAWDFKERKVRFTTSGRVFAASGDCRLVATGDYKTGNRWKIWDTQSGAEVADLGVIETMKAIAFSQDGRKLIVVGDDNGKAQVTLWSAN